MMTLDEARNQNIFYEEFTMSLGGRDYTFIFTPTDSFISNSYAGYLVIFGEILWFM